MAKATSVVGNNPVKLPECFWRLTRAIKTYIMAMIITMAMIAIGIG
jgi:hypothetical protein